MTEQNDQLNWKKRKEERKSRKESAKSGNYPSNFDQQQRANQSNWSAIAPWVQLMYVGITGFNVLFAIGISLWYVIAPNQAQWLYLLLLLIAVAIGGGMLYIYYRQKNFIRIGFFIQLMMGFFAILSMLNLWPSWLVASATILNGLAVIVDYFYIQRLDRSRLKRKS